MADRTFVALRTPGRSRVAYSGSFGFNTTNDPINLKGRGFTVAYDSQGTFTITFNSSFGQLDSISGSIQLASAAARFFQVGAVDASAGTAVVRNVDNTGTAQDEAVDANNRLNFVAYFRQSSIEN